MHLDAPVAAINLVLLCQLFGTEVLSRIALHKGRSAECSGPQTPSCAPLDAFNFQDRLPNAARAWLLFNRGPFEVRFDFHMVATTLQVLLHMSVLLLSVCRTQQYIVHWRCLLMVAHRVVVPACNMAAIWWSSAAQQHAGDLLGSYHMAALSVELVSEGILYPVAARWHFLLTFVKFAMQLVMLQHAGVLASASVHQLAMQLLLAAMLPYLLQLLARKVRAVYSAASKHETPAQLAQKYPGSGRDCSVEPSGSGPAQEHRGLDVIGGSVSVRSGYSLTQSGAPDRPHTLYRGKRGISSASVTQLDTTTGVQQQQQQQLTACEHPSMVDGMSQADQVVSRDEVEAAAAAAAVAAAEAVAGEVELPKPVQAAPRRRRALYVPRVRQPVLVSIKAQHMPDMNFDALAPALRQSALQALHKQDCGTILSSYASMSRIGPIPGLPAVEVQSACIPGCVQLLLAVRDTQRAATWSSTHTACGLDARWAQVLADDLYQSLYESEYGHCLLRVKVQVQGMLFVYQNGQQQQQQQEATIEAASSARVVPPAEEAPSRQWAWPAWVEQGGHPAALAVGSSGALQRSLANREVRVVVVEGLEGRVLLDAARLSAGPDGVVRFSLPTPTVPAACCVFVLDAHCPHGTLLMSTRFLALPQACCQELDSLAAAHASMLLPEPLEASTLPGSTHTHSAVLHTDSAPSAVAADVQAVVADWAAIALARSANSQQHGNHGQGTGAGAGALGEAAASLREFFAQHGMSACCLLACGREYEPTHQHHADAAGGQACPLACPPSCTCQAVCGTAVAALGLPPDCRCASGAVQLDAPNARCRGPVAASVARSLPQSPRAARQACSCLTVHKPAPAPVDMGPLSQQTHAAGPAQGQALACVPQQPISELVHQAAAGGPHQHAVAKSTVQTSGHRWGAHQGPQCSSGGMPHLRTRCKLRACRQQLASGQWAALPHGLAHTSGVGLMSLAVQQG